MFSRKMAEISKRKLLFGYLLLILAALLVTGLYWQGAMQQLTQVNRRQIIDQDAYIHYAIELKETGYTYPGDFARMPVYPVLQSLFYQPGMDRTVFFEQGKVRNLVLSLVLLAGVALIFWRKFGLLHASTIVLIVAFTVFVFKAGWFQAELLFYFLNFCLFILMWRLFKKPSLLLAILTGITAGLTHLTKASVLPGLLLFMLIYSLETGWKAVQAYRNKGENRKAWSSTYAIWVVPLVGISFLITVLPYIQASRRITGHYFYNVVSTFYVWYDSWEEASQGTRAFGDREGWPDMPADQIPSLSKYLREHTAAQIVERFINGGRLVVNRVVNSYGYAKYVVLYSAFLVFVAIRYRRRTRAVIRANRFLSLFVVAYFVAYLLLYFWYAPIAAGNRLILAQFLPLMFAILSGLQVLLKDVAVKLGRRPVDALVAFNLVVLCLLVFDIYLILSERIGTMVGGE